MKVKAMLKNTMLAISLSISATSLMLVPTLSAQAASPTDESLLQLIEVTKVVEMMDDMASDSGIAEQVTQSMLASLPSDNLTAEQREGLEQIVSEYSKEMTDISDMKNLNQQVVAAYLETAKQHFTQQEVDAQIAFYSSDEGQSIIDKQPAMMKDYMEQVMPIIMESTMEKVNDIVPKMIADIEALEIEQ